MTILVAFASRHGSTREVARAIADQLTDDGFEVELQAAEDVIDAAVYDAVVLGGALYTGRWQRDARRFLARHRATLQGVPLAVFAMGPRTTGPDDLAGSRAQLDRALVREPTLRPVSVAVFGGALDPAKLRFPFNRMAASDARDWAVIRAWAGELSTAFAPAKTPA